MRMLIIDAFTEQPFTGNPAPVCLLDGNDWPDTTWMQHVAAEMNLPMTAFARPLRSSSDADWGLRWFTPLVEATLCGHATMATAHALQASGDTAGTIRFETCSGILTVRTGDDGSITLDFPVATVAEVQPPDGFEKALGATADAIYGTGALRDVMAVLPNEAAVRAVAPDLAAVARLTRRGGHRGVIVTAIAADPGRGYDFVSRFFSPADGVPEDAVTGTAHTALTPYWAGRLGRNRLTGLQVSSRPGLVRVELHADRVHLTGHAVTVLDGTLRSASNAGEAGTSGPSSLRR